MNFTVTIFILVVLIMTCDAMTAHEGKPSVLERLLGKAVFNLLLFLVVFFGAVIVSYALFN